MEWTNQRRHAGIKAVELENEVGKAGASGSLKIFTVIGIIIFL